METLKTSSFCFDRLEKILETTTQENIYNLLSEYETLYEMLISNPNEMEQN